ncbi:MAG: hypothetical protein M3367_15625 [Acidobacteriota bacterium]|nr:hypothetical protein [Acidobacteriota bacterium]
MKVSSARILHLNSEANKERSAPARCLTRGLSDVANAASPDHARKSLLEVTVFCARVGSLDFSDISS